MGYEAVFRTIDIVAGIIIFIAIAVIVLGIIAICKMLLPEQRCEENNSGDNSVYADKKDVYLLDANYHLTYLEMDDEEITHVVDDEWEQWINDAEPDMAINDVNYNYKFLLVPEEGEAYLMYSRYKTNSGTEVKRIVSGSAGVGKRSCIRSILCRREKTC